jgi:hypothetical protein
MIGAPPESIGVACESGWMNAETFLQWLQHFQQHVRSSAARPVLLILDVHGSHKDLKVIEYARDSHIHVLSTLPHTTHKLQLDRVFFKPFNEAYRSASSTWMCQNPSARLTEYEVAELVNTEFTEVARLEIAQNGFRCIGIQPFDREIFLYLVFLGSALTDIPLIENQADLSTTQVCSHAATTENEPEPSTSASTLASSTLERETPRSSVNTEEVSDVLKILSPLPEASKKRLSLRKRRTQKSEI